MVADVREGDNSPVPTARPHEIEVSEGVSIFVKEREIKILPTERKIEVALARFAMLRKASKQ